MGALWKELPAELRLFIWEEFARDLTTCFANYPREVVDDDPENPRWDYLKPWDESSQPYPLAILQTCSLFYVEAKPILYENLLFYCYSSKDTIDALNRSWKTILSERAAEAVH